MNAILPSAEGRTAGAALPASLLLLMLTACGGGGGGASAPPPPPAPTVVQVSGASPLPAGCGIATASSQEIYTPDSAVQPQIAADPLTATTLYGLWEQDRWNAIGTRAVAFSVSRDGGASWGRVGILPFSACGGGGGAAYDRASDPSIAVGGGGTLYASALAFSAAGYLTGGLSAVLVSRSTDGGATWQPPVVIQSDAAAVNGYYHFNDRDAIAADPAHADVYLVWDRLTSDNTAESIPTWLAHSPDGGATWSTPSVIYDPGPLFQTFNNQPLVLPDGSVVVIFSLINGFGASQLTAIRSPRPVTGTSWSAPITVAAMQPVGTINPIAGGPPVRDSRYMAQTAVDPVNGTLAAVWQEGSFSAGVRDGIALTLSSDGGRTWSTMRQVNTDHAVAAFDPAVHFGSGGRIAVTYYDFRGYSAGSSVLGTSLWLIESTDGGATWTETRLTGPFDLNKAPLADQQAGATGNALFLGDQQGLGWNGSAWTAFNAVGTASGSRVFAVTAP